MKYSTLTDFSLYLQKVSSQEMPRSLLLQGSDPFDIEEAYRLFRDCCKRLFEEVTFSRLQESQDLESLLAPSLFSRSKTVVIVEELDRLKTRQQDFLKRYLARPSQSSIVILKGSSPEFLKLVSLALSLPEEKPWDKEPKVVNWIVSFLAEKAVSISSQLATLIAKECSADRFFLKNELEKLVLFLGERKKVEQQDVMAVMTLESKSTLWQLSDVYMQRNSAKAIQILKSLEEQEIHGIVIVRHLRHAVHQALQMRSLFDEEEPIVSIAERFPQLKGKMFERSFQRARELDPSFLAKSLICIDEAESALKNSPFDEQTVLINLLMRAMKPL